jgi:hypothetical protein
MKSVLLGWNASRYEGFCLLTFSMLKQVICDCGRRFACFLIPLLMYLASTQTGYSGTCQGESWDCPPIAGCIATFEPIKAEARCSQIGDTCCVYHLNHSTVHASRDTLWELGLLRCDLPRTG